MMSAVKKLYAGLRQAAYKRRLRGKVIFDRKTSVSCDTVFEGGNRVARGASLKSCRIGYGTIIGFDADMSNTRVGRYCSVVPKIVRGRHPVDRVSTHPAFYSLAKQAGFTYAREQSFEEFKYAEPESKTSVVIGNDVWIATGAVVVEGVTIGDGAVVMCGAVVTKDVPPYAIVGGVPAKVVRYRFDPETIDWLLRLRWWDKDRQWIQDHAAYFSDPQTLRRMVEEEQKSQGE